ncbi:hypothetical protein PG993_003736 [Apiospora rasikravindrae]|uniref:Uncharacterized protein n=1 Tax=Apiospora rasikravindrae TaxID=990691 RepID=A0ABR1U0C1_9PEZI
MEGNLQCTICGGCRFAVTPSTTYLSYFRETVGSMIEPPSAAPNDPYGRLVMGTKSGKVKGVRINCLGDAAAAVNLHPTLLPSKATARSKSPKASAIPGPSSRRGASSGWMKGSILLVDREKRDLNVRKVRAVCRPLDERIMPLLDSKVEIDRRMVLNALTEEEVEKYIQ